MYTNDKTYTILELTPAPQPCTTAPTAPRPGLWQRLGEALLRWVAPGHGPTIHCTTLASGEQRWRVFNPATGTRLVFESEAAVRTWMETAWLNKPALNQPDPIDRMRYRLR